MESLNEIDDFIREVDNASDKREVFAALRKQVSRLGFEFYTYELLWTANGIRKPLYDTTYDSQWVKHYNEKKYEIFDLICRHTAQTVRPFQWVEICHPRHMTKQQMQIVNEGAEAGVRSGGTVPIHGPGAASGYLTVSSRMADGEFSKLFMNCRHEVHLLATYTHERIIKIEQAPDPQSKFKLSPHEIEILCWTARGKTSEEIADIMNLSPHTVNKHIQNACKRLNVYNKVHAVALALSNRLIAI